MPQLPEKENQQPIIWKGIRKFYMEHEAVLYAARLRDLGVPAELSNRHVANPLPLTTAHYELKVPVQFEQEAKNYLRKIEEEVVGFDPTNESYRDISKEEIHYLKRVNKGGFTLYRVFIVLLILLLLSMIIRAVINGATEILF